MTTYRPRPIDVHTGISHEFPHYCLLPMIALKMTTNSCGYVARTNYGRFEPAC